jgi:hypothetical protein
MSALTWVTLSRLSTAARAVSAVPPQTTPGVDSWYETDEAMAEIEIRVVASTAMRVAPRVLRVMVKRSLLV